MTRGMWRALMVVPALAGCLLPGSVDISGSGVSTGLVTQRLACDGSGTVDRYEAGSGGLLITISDATHAPAYNDKGDVTGEINDSHDVEGAPGTWQLSVDPSGFAGQFKITLSCL